MDLTIALDIYILRNSSKSFIVYIAMSQANYFNCIVPFNKTDSTIIIWRLTQRLVIKFSFLFVEIMFNYFFIFF